MKIKDLKTYVDGLAKDFGDYEVLFPFTYAVYETDDTYQEFAAGDISADSINDGTKQIKMGIWRY